MSGREEIMRVLNEGVESGRVRYLGASSEGSTLPLPELMHWA